MKSGSFPGKPRSLMMAVVLGTALTAMEARGEANRSAVQDIARYCTACWRNARLPTDRWPDCTQEVLLRLIERVELPRWSRVMDPEGDERKEFLRAIDAVKKRVQRRKQPTALPAQVATDRRLDPAGNYAEDWEVVNSAAARVLSPRQLRIIELSRDGYPVPEIARELNTTPERISDEKYKAIRKIQKALGV